MPHIATSVLVEVGDVHLHAVVTDPLEPAPGARSFLLVHGLASNAQLWGGMSAELAARGHRVVAVDQRGHGLSSKVDDGFDFATLTDDLVAVADAMDLERPVVVGQSWGANVALELAVRHPALLVPGQGRDARCPDTATPRTAGGWPTSRSGCDGGPGTGRSPASAGSWPTSCADRTGPSPPTPPDPGTWPSSTTCGRTTRRSAGRTW